MPLVYSNEMLQADELIDEIKENLNIAGIVVQPKDTDPEFDLYISAVVLRNKLVNVNMFSSITISITRSIEDSGKIYIGYSEDETERKEYEKYKDFILCAYKNLIDIEKRKALVTPKHVLVPYGNNYEDNEGYSTHPYYLVYER